MPSADSTVLYRAIPKIFSLATPEKRTLESFAKTIRERVGRGRHFTCLISNDQELRKLNKAFLGHDYATDVLSFPSSPGSSELGELAISLERAAEQAQAFRHSRVDELCVLMLHGVLHLIGLDHETDAGEMRHVEQHWREALKLPSGLIEREEVKARS